MLTLKTLCELSTNDLAGALMIQYPHAMDNPGGVYIDNGSNVLAVAHLDTIQDYNRAKMVIPDIRYQMRGNRIYSMGLDDRLGVHIIINMLRERGIIPDMLFTFGEESMQSSALEFKTDKAHNWIAEFDRKGINPVLYQYDCPDLRELLRKTGYTVDIGTYSDIADLEFLGIKAINFGAGYTQEHTPECHARVKDIYRAVGLFVKFYQANKDKKLIHTPQIMDYRYTEYRDYISEDYNDDIGEWGVCQICRAENELYYGVCYDCADYLGWDKSAIDNYIRELGYLENEDDL